MNNIKPKNLREFFENIKYNWEMCKIRPHSTITMLDIIPNVFEITPIEFLEYAHQDFELSNNHGFINALTNVKRAIECQSDIIHASFGIPYEKLNFPKKIENIQKMGISQSKILKNINSIRVDLEHYYKNPNPDRVDDAIQVAQFFLDLTSFFMNNFMSQYDICQKIDEDESIKEKKYSLDDIEDEDEKKNRIESFLFDLISDIQKINLMDIIKISYEKENFQFKIIQTENNEMINEIIISKDNLDDYLKLINITMKIGKNGNKLRNDEDLQRSIIEEFRNNFN